MLFYGLQVSWVTLLIIPAMLMFTIFTFSFSLILSSLNDMRRFLRSIKHIKMRKERKLEFSRQAFEPEKHKDTLKDYNVRIDFEL